jgi:hypothetical protein
VYRGVKKTNSAHEQFIRHAYALIFLFYSCAHRWILPKKYAGVRLHHVYLILINFQWFLECCILHFNKWAFQLIYATVLLFLSWRALLSLIPVRSSRDRLRSLTPSSSISRTSPRSRYVPSPPPKLSVHYWAPFSIVFLLILECTNPSTQITI